MTSINYNIPTRTFVPTTTQQPTGTNTTVTGSGVAGTASNVPTPTSSLVYTASAPRTNNPEVVEVLERLQKEINDAKAYLDKCQEEENQLTQKIDTLNKKAMEIRHKMSKAGCTESHYLNEELHRINEEIEELCDMRTALYSKIRIAKLLYQEKLNEMHELCDNARDYFSDVPNLLSPTVTGPSPTRTGGAPTVTTGNVPYYPTGT